MEKNKNYARIFTIAVLLQTIFSIENQAITPSQGFYDNNTNLYQIDQDTPDPEFFRLMPVFEGNWKGKSGISRQFGEFMNVEGWMRCQFAYAGPANAKMFVVEIVDGVLLFTTRFTWTN